VEETEKQKDTKGNCALVDFKVFKDNLNRRKHRGWDGGVRNEKRWGASRASKLPGKSLVSGRICALHGVFMACSSCVSRVLLSI